MRVTGPDGRAAEVTTGATAGEALGALDLRRGQVVVAKLDGELADLDVPVADGQTVEPVPADSDQGRHVLRHSVAHVMAQAVTDLFPEAKFAIGPPVADGFYYDFDVERPFTPDDLEAISSRMHEIIREDQAFRRRELDPDEALEVFADQPYKREIIDRATRQGAVSGEEAGDVDPDAGGAITVYENVRADGSVWPDLCRGPHLPTTRWIPAFSLQRVAGAYWRGDESQPMLQRIYGTAWESRKALKQHLELLEEARKRDHRKLGRELELVHFPEELGPGMAIFLPKGAIVRKEMEDWIRAETLRRGYEPVYTPHVAREELWETSGHLENYAELMFPGMELEAANYRLKPMNCPFHIMAFTSRTRSYRELPLRISELGTVYRNERSGVVNGMLRARGFTQDDSHIFCRDDQIVDEVAGCIDFARDVFATFGLGEASRIAVSTRPAKAFGTDEQWATAEQQVIEAVQRTGLEYETDPGEGAFYGPKVDVHARDALGREWQLSTIQVDFNLPERFDITYAGEDGAEHRPFMVHRALFGSIERFFAVLLESTAGAFPTWLAPVQAVVVPIADRHHEGAEKVARTFLARGLRAEVDTTDDTMGAKIRKHQLAKVPYQLIVGDEELEAGTVSVRPRRGEQRKGVEVEAFAEELAREVGDRVTE
ncbi:threonine--tRNA ligase [Egibacter rhizosphaerae]|uniref:Threonine--tRNA ligase n=1 Tax=Egibacter rhizosphaerae TaxID=1670831 RepID=A0A411YLR9_9ACTN|nr:threonine--tRNA ligase [Egibacter rhizosphaerae]